MCLVWKLRHNALDAQSETSSQQTAKKMAKLVLPLMPRFSHGKRGSLLSSKPDFSKPVLAV